MNYSFDYDNTLIKYKYVYDSEGNIIDAVYDCPHYENIELLRELANSGNTVYIITARIKGLSFEKHIDNSPKPDELVKELDLPVTEIFYTTNKCKLPTLLKMNITAHWDDCPEQCDTIRDSGLLKVWEVQAPLGINSFLKEKFRKLLEKNVA